MSILGELANYCTDNRIISSFVQVKSLLILHQQYQRCLDMYAIFKVFNSQSFSRMYKFIGIYKSYISFDIMAKLKYNADISNNISVCNLLTLDFLNPVEITFNFSSNFLSFLKINITRNEIFFFPNTRTGIEDTKKRIRRCRCFIDHI